MYLVHARLESNGHAKLPANTLSLVTRSARPDEHLQHAVMHSDGVTGLVLGLFLLAPTLAEAEHAAVALCQRALDENAVLQRFRLVSCGVAMPTSYYELMLQSTTAEYQQDEQ
ncbi:hypothetical protein ACFYRD_39745 [Streptomyces hirsutus]|uniref:hypothetical protein n=1 Tax=Streptomyces hirsutus TaxID=35620 RepID=UPI0036859475